MDSELFSLPDADQLLRVSSRLAVAAVLGGLIGAEREYVGKAAGLRTHMTVALGSAAFVLIILENGGNSEALARAVQGVAAGIGFIGAGTILKRGTEEDIQGLTTAATIWLTAAIGLAAGAGLGWLATVAVVCAWLILVIMSGVARWLNKQGKDG
jgi:putative Mg2+ transporter-C (MgtC) family protein